MNELATELLRRYGWKAIALAIFGFAVFWIVAHYNAAPGDNISLFWGIVQYTKRSEESPNQKNTDSVAIATDQSSVPQSNVDSRRKFKRHLEIIAHGVSTGTWHKRIADFRKQAMLRELSTLESGKGLYSMPPGTFGYISASDFSSADPALMDYHLGRTQVYRFNKPDKFGPKFEVHSNQEKTLLILAFTSEGAATAITSAKTRDITLSAEPQQDLTTFVLLPIDQLYVATLRYVETRPGIGFQVVDIRLQ